MLREIVINCWLVLAEMAPYLLLGFAIAGAMSVLVSAAWVGRHLGGRGFWPTVNATVLGVPLPLCSCGVIPVSAGLRKQGAGRGPTSAFLLATPETGVDSILATYALLGPVFAVVRPVVALIGGIICGLMVDWFGEKDEKEAPEVMDDGAKPQADNCCAGDDGKGNRFTSAARYGFVTLPGDIAVHLIIGILVAGVLVVLIDPGAAKSWLGGGLVAMLAMMAIGLPLYVCATGSIPLAVAFMHMGASPGAALVFLIAGPATNAATIAVTWKLLGPRSAVVYLLVVAATALGAGYAIDLLWSPASLMMPDVSGEHAMDAIGWFGHLSAAALAGLLIYSLIARRRAAHTASTPHAPADTDEETAVLQIKGMTCSHCAAATTRALSAVPGVSTVQVDLRRGAATVHGGPLDRDAMKQAVESLGYTITS